MTDDGLDKDGRRHSSPQPSASDSWNGPSRIARRHCAQAVAWILERCRAHRRRHAPPGLEDTGRLRQGAGGAPGRRPPRGHVLMLTTLC